MIDTIFAIVSAFLFVALFGCGFVCGKAVGREEMARKMCELRRKDF